MKERLRTVALIGGMAAASSSAGCGNEVTYPESYDLNFNATTIPCGDIEFFTPYDKEHYCKDKDGEDVVTIDKYYDTSLKARQNITNALRCVLKSLSFVRVDLQSADANSVLTHVGGFARESKGGTGTYDDGNSNELQDYIYVADRSNFINPQGTFYFKKDMLTFIALHEIGHTLGLEHGSVDSIMAENIYHSVEYPFHFTRSEAELLLNNTHGQVTEEKIEGLTKADERCAEELSAVKSE